MMDEYKAISVNDFIKILQDVPEDKRKLPMYIFCTRCEEVYPIGFVDTTISDRVDINTRIQYSE